jgi:hypothetical protein
VDVAPYRTIEECDNVHPNVWSAHVLLFRARAQEELRLALTRDVEPDMEHWRLMTHLLELLPRDWHPYGLLDRWGGGYHGESGDCSSGCVHYRPLRGHLGGDWGVCTNPASHRAGKLTFEHQGCPAFEAEPWPDGRDDA